MKILYWAMKEFNESIDDFNSYCEIIYEDAEDDKAYGGDVEDAEGNVVSGKTPKQHSAFIKKLIALYERAIAIFTKFKDAVVGAISKVISALMNKLGKYEGKKFEDLVKANKAFANRICEIRLDKPENIKEVEDYLVNFNCKDEMTDEMERGEESDLHKLAKKNTNYIDNKYTEKMTVKEFSNRYLHFATDFPKMKQVVHSIESSVSSYIKELCERREALKQLVDDENVKDIFNKHNGDSADKRTDEWAKKDTELSRAATDMVNNFYDLVYYWTGACELIVRYIGELSYKGDITNNNSGRYR